MPTGFVSKKEHELRAKILEYELTHLKKQMPQGFIENMKVKYKNVINIQLKLWELCHPTVKIKITYNSTYFEILMTQGFTLDKVTINNQEWNDDIPDNNYYKLQRILNKMYDTILIKEFKLFGENRMTIKKYY